MINLNPKNMSDIIPRYCKVCGEEIHPKRVKLGYKDTCVNHSTTERYVGKVFEVDTETYEVVPMKPEVAKELSRLENEQKRLRD